jgi:hypothetical protein
MEMQPIVWPDKFVRGIKNLNGPHLDKEGKPFNPTTGYPMPLRKALETAHASDAHITCYGLRSNDGVVVPKIPLFTKAVLKQIKQEGADLYMSCIGFDWDTPGHIQMTPEVYVDFLNRFFTAAEADERLGQWSSYYTTRGGVRIFYELTEPVQVEDAEKYLVTMLKEFKRHDILMDPCKDWTRRFRLPKVMRDGLPTHEEPLFDLQFQDAKLDIRQFKKSDLKSLVVAEPFQRKGRFPQQEECLRILYEEGMQGKKKQTWFHKRAKAILKNTPYFDVIFELEYMCGDTGRNDYFCKMLGFIVPKLIQGAKASCEQIFALLYEPLHELEPLPGKADPVDHCWNILQDIYERDHAKHIEEKQKEAEAIENGQTALERIAAGMMQWCDADTHPDLYSEDNAVVEAFVRARLFAFVGKYYYPIDKDGWYSNLCLTKEQLIPRIRKSFLKDIIETQKMDFKGNVVSVSPAELSNNHSTVVHEVRMTPLQGVKGRIDDMDGEKPTLQLPMYQRNSYLPAEFSDAVDGWLRSLFGDNYTAATKWIGYALDFEAGPICALSLSGAGSVGKKMLVEGLAECLVEPFSASGNDMCGGYNGALLKTPFLFVNEGWPKVKGMAPSDLFKAYTAGDAIYVREIYKPPISIISPIRILFTANDHGLLHELTRGKELTPETKKAMGERLMHFEIDRSAEQYLKRLGGRTFTEREGARWIRGDSGQPSDFIVAKHFMWLYKNRPPMAKGDRYCVMGNCGEDDHQTFKMASQSDYHAPVLRGVVALFETKGVLESQRFYTKEGRIFVTMAGVLTSIREGNGEVVPERALESVLRSIMIRTKPYPKDGKSFYELSLPDVWEFAHHWSVTRGKLKQIKEAWEAHRAGQ